MLYVTIYTWPPESRKAIVARFMETGGQQPPGVKLLGRWTDVGGGRDLTLTESDDSVAMGKFIYGCNDLMDFEVILVNNDERLAQVLAG